MEISVFFYEDTYFQNFQTLPLVNNDKMEDDNIKIIIIILKTEILLVSLYRTTDLI